MYCNTWRNYYMKYQHSPAINIVRFVFLVSFAVPLLAGLILNWKLTLGIIIVIVFVILWWALTRDSNVKEDASNSFSNNAPSMGPYTGTGEELSEAAIATREKIAARKSRI